MLSRTADGLFWMARYVERAETMARLVDTARRMVSLSHADPERGGDLWAAILAASGCAPHFYQNHETADRESVCAYLLLDRENPSSVVSCFEYARANARSLRTAVTREMWEAVNDAWIESRVLAASKLDNGAMQPVLDWVIQRGALFRGAADASMLHDDGFDFLRLGLALERTDSTARLLDVKSASTHPALGGEPLDDTADWVAILRSGGVQLGYHRMYRADYDVRRIVDFMVLNPCCPRALANSADMIHTHLGRLGRLYGVRGYSHHKSAETVARLADLRIDDVLRAGLGQFLSDTIIGNNILAATIASDYHFAPAPLDLRIEEEEAKAAVEQAAEISSVPALAAMAQSQSQAIGTGKSSGLIDAA
ncbi:MAG: alpha-E domain-containing protein [Pseudomonadota bacterium]